MKKRRRRKPRPVRPQEYVEKAVSAQPANVSNKEHSNSSLRHPFHLKTFLLLLIIGLGVYVNSFGNDFVWDDLMIVTPNEFIRDWKYIKEIFLTDVHHFAREQSNFYRPLQILTYSFDYFFWQLKPLGYHITNTLLHITNAYIIYILFVLIVGRLQPKEEKRIKIISISAVLLWLVPPVHAQCTTYISGRADLLVTAFILLAVYTHIKRKSLCFPAGFFILALLSKELGMITPLLIFFVDFLLWPKDKRNLKRYGFYILILLAYVILRLTLFHFPTAVSPEEIPSLGVRLLTSARAMMILFRLLIYPFNLSMSRNIPWVDNLFDLEVVISILGIFALIYLAFFFRKKEPIITFGLTWFFVGYLPVLNIVPMNANVSEHWMYLPSIGIFLLVAYILFKVTKEKLSLFLPLILILLIFWGFLLIKRNNDFKNEIILFQQIISRDPDNARAHYNLGTAYVRKDNYDLALRHLKKAVTLKPDYAGAYGNMGQIFFRQGKIQKAIRYYEKANAYADNLVENHANLGRAYAETGQYDKAEAELKKALKLNPRHAGALNGLGIEYGRKGDYSTAEQFFRKVLELDPKNLAAQKNLDRIHSLKGPPVGN